MVNTVCDMSLIYNNIYFFAFILLIILCSVIWKIRLPSHHLKDKMSLKSVIVFYYFPGSMLESQSESTQILVRHKKNYKKTWIMMIQIDCSSTSISGDSFILRDFLEKHCVFDATSQCKVMRWLTEHLHSLHLHHRDIEEEDGEGGQRLIFSLCLSSTSPCGSHVWSGRRSEGRQEEGGWGVISRRSRQFLSLTSES